MQIENAFSIAAPPDRVYAFLLDVNHVVGCVPGAELSEVVDPSTFKGRVRIKVGPVTVAYAGTARITERDETKRTATLEGEGRETTGPGSARAKAQMKVEKGADGGSNITISTDLAVAGRVAQFGRGLMEDVSRSLVNQMAECIREQLERSPEAPPEPPAESTPDSGAASPDSEPPPAATGGSVSRAVSAPTVPRPVAPRAARAVAPPVAKPVNAFGLLWSVFVARLLGQDHARGFARPEPTRTYRVTYGPLWFTRRPGYVLYMIRDVSVVFVSAWFVWLIWELYRLHTGDFTHQSVGTGFVIFSVVALFFALWHSITFLNLSGLILRIPFGDGYLPPVFVKAIAFGGWALASVIGGFLLIWLGSFKQ